MSLKIPKEGKLNLDHLAEILGVRVVETDSLHAEVNGMYLHRRRTILLRRDLDRFTRRATLGHELAHAFHGDELHGDERLERRADQWSARLLISEDDYRTAEALHGPHPGAIAHELGVTPDVVKTWRNLHERTLTQ